MVDRLILCLNLLSYIFLMTLKLLTQGKYLAYELLLPTVRKLIKPLIHLSAQVIQVLVKLAFEVVSHLC